MAVIVSPRFARSMSDFMFSASMVGLLAGSGLEGIEPAAAGAEMFREGAPGPLVLEVP